MAEWRPLTPCHQEAAGGGQQGLQPSRSCQEEGQSPAPSPAAGRPQVLSVCWLHWPETLVL